MACDVLLVAAFQPELGALVPRLGEGLRGRVGGLDVAASVVGIGATMAAVGTAMRLVELGPKLVVAVGTCGAYAGSGLVIGDVACPGRVLLGCPAVADGLAEFPAPMSVLTETHGFTTAALRRAGGREGDVAATLAITVDDVTAERLSAALGAAAEHLEAHGMAVACAARGIPFAAALGVANVVGSRARDEWRKHHRAAAGAAAEVVLTWLEAAGGGT